MLGIKQSRDHMTNQNLYQLTRQVPLLETICERQLKFIYVIYNWSLYPHADRRTRQPIYHLWIKDQIIFSTRSTKDYISQSNFIANSTILLEISRSRIDKKDGGQQILRQIFVVSKKKKSPDLSSKLWWWTHLTILSFSSHSEFMDLWKNSKQFKSI